MNLPQSQTATGLQPYFTYFMILEEVRQKYGFPVLSVHFCPDSQLLSLQDRKLQSAHASDFTAFVIFGAENTQKVG